MRRLFKAVGTLKRGHLVEVGRSDLVGAVVGETAIKTQIVVDRAVGGVLIPNP
jgi:stage V sporulation protein K